jgi:hypothetical protein
MQQELKQGRTIQAVLLVVEALDKMGCARTFDRRVDLRRIEMKFVGQAEIGGAVAFFKGEFE